MIVKKTYPRCVSICRDGTQCGRRVTDGSQPPVCHIHARPSASPIIPDKVDELKVLQKLARDPNPQVRLRAVDLLLDLKAKAAQAPDLTREEGTDQFLDELTPEETARLDVLMEQFLAFKETVFARAPHLRPLSEKTRDDAL